jgi:hypothetical protein
MGSKRRPIRLGVRFEIFKRDAFTCQYCGKKPPEALLEVDHIVPVAKGGGNEETNLITSCLECNRGKSARPLGEITPVAVDRAEELKERALQAQAYSEAVALRNSATQAQIDMINEAWCDAFDGYREGGLLKLRRGSFPNERTLRIFLNKIPLDVILDCINITASRKRSWPESYFYAVCWRRIRGEE